MNSFLMRCSYPQRSPKIRRIPLIIALHGLREKGRCRQNTMMRGNALQLAEESGYDLVGPMGYNSGGWYGAPARFGSGGGQRGSAQLPGEAVTGQIWPEEALKAGQHRRRSRGI